MDGSFVPALSHARLWGNSQQLGYGRVPFSALMFGLTAAKRLEWGDTKAGIPWWRSTLFVLYVPGNGLVSGLTMI